VTQKKTNKVVWITGLSGSGKTTLANALKERIVLDLLLKAEIIDGDDLRKERKLSFSYADRLSNVYHGIYKAFTFIDKSGGDVSIVSMISPKKEMRDIAKQIIKSYTNAEFYEVYMDIPLDICERRDPKGLYKLARSGKIKEFTGIDSIYEMPINPNIIITHDMSVNESVEEIIKVIF
jgi:adenylyl-sulfate kinase